LSGTWDEQRQFLQLVGQVWWHAISDFCTAKPCRVIDASLITEMKDMAEQNRRLKRMYAEMRMSETIF
jgi:hypothetical protein